MPEKSVPSVSTGPGDEAALVRKNWRREVCTLESGTWPRGRTPPVTGLGGGAPKILPVGLVPKDGNRHLRAERLVNSDHKAGS